MLSLIILSLAIIDLILLIFFWGLALILAFDIFVGYLCYLGAIELGITSMFLKLSFAILGSLSAMRILSNIFRESDKVQKYI